MKRVPRTPHELGMVALLAQLRRNAGRGMVVGLLALPLLAVHAPRRSDWIIGATLAVTAAIQTGLAIYKAAHIGRLVDAERTTPSRATGAVDVVRGLSSGALAAIALSVTGIVLAASGLANLWPLPRASSILDARPWPQVLLIGLLLAGIGGLGITLATSRTLRGPTGAESADHDVSLLATEPASMPAHLPEPTAPYGPHAGLAIACSGGGIRAAAFCLGGLQRLMREGIYDKADRVYAISGGSYIATAMHLARRNSDPIPVGAPAPFAPDSPEMDWVRRHSSWITPNATTRTRGVLALTYGILTTLAHVAALIWIVTAYGIWTLSRLPEQRVASFNQTVASFDVSPTLAGILAGLAGTALLWLVVSNAVLKYRRRRLATLAPTATLLSLAAAIALTLTVIPALVVLTHNATISNQPMATIAKTLRLTGLVPHDLCQQAIREDFVREAQIAWHRVVKPAEQESIPFSFGACGENYEDDAALYPAIAGAPLATTTGSKHRPAASLTTPDPPDCGIVTGPLPHYCDVNRDTTGGWATRLAGLTGALTALLALWRKRTPAEASSRTDKLTAFIHKYILPWSALAVAVAIVAIVGMRMGRTLSVEIGRLDQWRTYAVPLGVYVVGRLVGDATITSLHPFYRERLADAFLVRRNATGVVEPIPLWDTPIDPGLDADTNTDAEATGPQLSILCAANVSDPDFIPTQRSCTTFRFETGRRTHGSERPRAYIGVTDSRLPQEGRGANRLRDGARPIPISPTAYSQAADPAGRDTTLASAMAASGAAFSPIVGRKQSLVAPYRILLTLANGRLGVWLPNPYVALVNSSSPSAHPPLPTSGFLATAWERIIHKPGPFRIFKEASGLQSITDSRIYISDGGHFDNTGLVEALRDRPRRLILFEASADPAGSADALTDAITTARMDLGLVITAGKGGVGPICTPAPTTENPRPRAERAWVHLQARREGYQDVCTDIYVVKNVLSTGGDIELDAYQLDHPDFPVTGTTNQFYGEYDFEAYRQLGWRNTHALLTEGVQPDQLTG